MSLKEAVLGTQTKIKIPSHTPCNICNSSGAAPGSSPSVCGRCNGVGQVRVQLGFFSLQQTCSSCAGTGQVIKDKCKPCNGIGATKEEKTLSVNIPSGVDNGDKVRLSGEGEWMKGSKSGDLYVSSLPSASDISFSRSSLFSVLKSAGILNFGSRRFYSRFPSKF